MGAPLPVHPEAEWLVWLGLVPRSRMRALTESSHRHVSSRQSERPELEGVVVHLALRQQLRSGPPGASCSRRR